MWTKWGTLLVAKNTEQLITGHIFIKGVYNIGVIYGGWGSGPPLLEPKLCHCLKLHCIIITVNSSNLNTLYISENEQMLTLMQSKF